MTAQELMNIAPVDWEKTVDAMSTTERHDMQHELEGIAERAAMCAGYVEEREGYGCGDQGHASAMKTANRYGRRLHVTTFGYSEFRGVRL